MSLVSRIVGSSVVRVASSLKKPSAGPSFSKRAWLSTLNPNSASSKIYELREYDIVPQDFGKFIQHTNNFIHLRCGHSKLLGYWMTEVGGLNKVVHIWEYNSLSHRAKIEESLSNDHLWFQNYWTITSSMLVRQSNTILLWAPSIKGLNCEKLPMELPPSCKPDTPHGYYRLIEAKLPRKIAARNEYLNLLRRTAEFNAAQKIPCSLYGVWFTALAGSYNNCVTLWQAPDLDSLFLGGVFKEDNMWVLEDSCETATNGLILTPCRFSDWR